MIKRIITVSFEIFINIVISIVLLGILGKILSLSVYEQIVIGTLFFLCTLAIWVRSDLVRMAQNSDELVKDRSSLLRTIRHVEFFASLDLDLRKISDNLKTLTERYCVFR